MDDHLQQLLAAVGPDHDAVQSAMLDHTVSDGFPTVGADAGGVLRLLARLVGAEAVFEFGSGFGYSASWFARGMRGGRIVLTEYDADELALAREFLDGAYDVDFAFESGDAMASFTRYDGPFDVILLDHEGARYAPAFARVRSSVAPGGVVVADNVAAGPVDAGDLVSMLDADTDPLSRTESWDVDTETEGIAAYLELVRADPDFETVLLPVGEGLAVSVRVD